MAFFTRYTDMTPRQWEVALLVIEGDIIPTGWVMAGGTISAKVSSMLIVLFMTGIAIGGGSLVNTISMACFAV